MFSNSEVIMKEEEPKARFLGEMKINALYFSFNSTQMDR